MERDRAEGWKHAKCSGHQNEDKIRELIEKDLGIRNEIKSVSKKEGNFTSIKETGIGETNVESILDDTTKSKPDIKIELDNQQTINISIKKSTGGQVFLISTDRFIRGYEKQYNEEIDKDIKKAIGLFWGTYEDCNKIIDENSDRYKSYEKKKNRLTGYTLKKYNEDLSDKLIRWFQNNITNIFDFCFAKGLAKGKENWADLIWYKNLIDGEKDPNTMFSINDLKQKIKGHKDMIQYGKRNGGTTITLPFGFVQWHQGQMQFHHSLKSLISL